jgi:putative membrane protein
MMLVIGERFMAMCGLFIFALPILIVVILAIGRVNRYSIQELREHMGDYPWSSAGEKLDKS